MLRRGGDEAYRGRRALRKAAGRGASAARRLARRVVTVEENALAGGFGSAVLEKIGTGDEIVPSGFPMPSSPHGDRARVLADIGLTPQAVALAARAHSPALTRVK